MLTQLCTTYCRYFSVLNGLDIDFHLQCAVPLKVIDLLIL